MLKNAAMTSVLTLLLLGSASDALPVKPPGQLKIDMKRDAKGQACIVIHDTRPQMLDRQKAEAQRALEASQARERRAAELEMARQQAQRDVEMAQARAKAQANSSEAPVMYKAPPKKASFMNGGRPTIAPYDPNQPPITPGRHEPSVTYRGL